jgi:hypothetical protein
MPPGTLDFYAAAAGVIPVLVLVLIVEQRTDRRAVSPFQNLVLLLVTIATAAIGEMVAFRALYRGHAHLQDQWFVVVGLVIPALALVVPIVMGSLRDVSESGARVPKAVGWTATIVVTYVVVALFIVLVQQKG